MKTFSLILAAGALFALAACGQPAQTGAPAPTAEQSSAGVSLADPWAAVSPSGATVAAGYVTLRNEDGLADRLVSASSPRAARVEMHQMTADGAVMRMRPVTGIDVPGHGEAALAPGGLHLMFFDITAPFVAGEDVPVTLRFERQGDVEAAFPVRPRNAAAGEHGAH